jgi:SET domain-containing protein
MTRASKVKASPLRKEKPYRVRNSPIHGRGVFATRTIRKGSKIVEYRGIRISEAAANRQPVRDPKDPHHTFLFQLSDGTIIDAGTRGNRARWINHSCAPNCESVEYADGRIFIHARRTIRAGEELGYDYRIVVEGKISTRDRRAYACACKTDRCRGTLLLEARRRGK